MKLQLELERLLKRYPTLSSLDVHYISMKHHGVRDCFTDYGRPTWNLINEQGLFHITFGTSEDDSPYFIENGVLRWDGGTIPFRVDFVERVPVIHGRYYYFRHTDFLTPTLDDRLVLNLNFQRQCTVCEFCQFQLYANKPNITAQQGFNLIFSRGDLSDLTGVDEIAVVTGLFGSSTRIKKHLSNIIDIATEKYGFKGSLFYMGFELDCKDDIRHIVKKVQDKGMSGFRIAYTLENFGRRIELMHGRKGKVTLERACEILNMMRSEGVSSLEYAYIPGLDQLEDFYKGAEILLNFARPHLCVFRPWRTGQRHKLASDDYLHMGPAYLCEVRSFYEKLYESSILGNNLASLWPFPLNRISDRWITDRIVGPDEGRRWWNGKTDLRALDHQIITDVTGGK